MQSPLVSMETLQWSTVGFGLGPRILSHLKTRPKRIGDNLPSRLLSYVYTTSAPVAQLLRRSCAAVAYILTTATNCFFSVTVINPPLQDALVRWTEESFCQPSCVYSGGYLDLTTSHRSDVLHSLERCT